MVSRTYEPVRITNPTEGHLVPLLPGQDFIIFLDDQYPEIEFDSPFFDLTRRDIGKSSCTLYFKQKYNLEDWSKVSRAYLGNVSILTDSYFGSLCVFLETANKVKSRVLTVVNPDVSYVKIEPYTLIEVVVFDVKHNAENWDCTIISGETGLKCEQFEYKRFDPFDHKWSWQELDQFCFAYPRADLFLDKTAPIFEHHYWFRFDRASLVNMPNLSPGSYAAGKIIIDTDDSKYHVLNLNVRIKGKHRVRMLENYQATKHALIFPSQSNFRRNVPRDSIYKQNISLKRKLDSELHSHKVVYF